LKRRINELENITRTIGGAGGGGGGGGGRGESPSLRTAGSRFNKERDTEMVVESLRKVVDKLKAENERLKRGVGTGEGKTNDVEKRLVTERKRTEKLEEDVCLSPPPLPLSLSLSLSLSHTHRIKFSRTRSGFSKMVDRSLFKDNNRSPP
jgi:hypothetical protein